MSYRPPFFFNTQQLSQSQQTSPGQQQSQQPPTLVQTSPSVASYQPPLPAVAPWHQPQQQTFLTLSQRIKAHLLLMYCIKNLSIGVS